MISKYIDIKLFKYLTVFFTLVMLLHTSKLVYFKNKGEFVDLGWYDLFAYTVFLKWLFVLVFMIALSRIVKWMIEKQIAWRYRVIIHLFLSVFMFFFVFFLGSAYLFTFAHFNLQQAIRNVSFEKYMTEIDEIFLIYFSLAGIIHGYYYLKKIKHIEEQKSLIQIDLMNSKLSMLKAQLQPIFIFNTLNSISDLIETDEEKSQNLIADFGDLFREIIESKDDNLIPLRKELQFLNKFIVISKVRYPDDFVFRINIDNGLREILVPSLILQPVFEYTMKRYKLITQTNLKAELNVSIENDYLVFNIKTYGELIEKIRKNPIIDKTISNNINERLKAIYSKDYVFEINDDKDKFEVNINIPIN